MKRRNRNIKYRKIETYSDRRLGNRKRKREEDRTEKQKYKKIEQKQKKIRR